MRASALYATCCFVWAPWTSTPNALSTPRAAAACRSGSRSRCGASSAPARRRCCRRRRQQQEEEEEECRWPTRRPPSTRALFASSASSSPDLSPEDAVTLRTTQPPLHAERCGTRAPPPGTETPHVDYACWQPCHACNGDTLVLCSNCDGEGVLPIEAHFADWVDDTACPFCDGTGAEKCTQCDMRGYLPRLHPREERELFTEVRQRLVVAGVIAERRDARRARVQHQRRQFTSVEAAAAAADGREVASCGSCNGEGTCTCPSCDGDGTLAVAPELASFTRGMRDEELHCQMCRGAGVVTCDVCAGSGRKPSGPSGRGA